jgi:hypothetical protein
MKALVLEKKIIQKQQLLKKAQEVTLRKGNPNCKVVIV